MEGYRTVGQAAEAEFEEKKSRFLGAISPVESLEEAMTFIDQRRQLHKQANHNCWAWNLLDGQQRYSDDGEPQGTAGVPILEVMKKEEIVNSVIVVTRYFGGTLLGAGGLVRAYSQSAKLALDAGERVFMTACHEIHCDLPYPLYDRVLNLLEDYPHEILRTDFSTGVLLALQMPQQFSPVFVSTLQEISSGSVIPTIEADSFAPISLGNAEQNDI